MNDEYLGVKAYWDDIFYSSPVNVDFIKNGIPFKDIEDSVVWLSKCSGKVLDFGCGNGTLLLRTIKLSGTTGMGIDLSQQAIKRACEASVALSLDGWADFITASIDALESLDDHIFNGMILSNVLDNLVPSDGLKLVKQINRIMMKGGRFYLKLNDFKKRQDMLDDGAVEIMSNLYKESQGLYLWNLDNDSVLSLFQPEFVIEQIKSIELMGTVNRTFHLIKR